MTKERRLAMLLGLWAKSQICAMERERKTTMQLRRAGEQPRLVREHVPPWSMPIALRVLRGNRRRRTLPAAEGQVEGRTREKKSEVATQRRI